LTPANWAPCGAGVYGVFDINFVDGVQDTDNPWAENIYKSDGTLCQAGGTGQYVSVGRDALNNPYLFFVNTNGNGTLISPNSALDGSGFSFTGISNPTLVQTVQTLQ
jgi:hypothetical protein